MLQKPNGKACDNNTHMLFRDLYKPHELKETDMKLISELEEAKQTMLFNELTFKITSDEIMNAIRELKLGKASGPCQPLW